MRGRITSCVLAPYVFAHLCVWAAADRWTKSGPATRGACANANVCAAIASERQTYAPAENTYTPHCSLRLFARSAQCVMQFAFPPPFRVCAGARANMYIISEYAVYAVRVRTSGGFIHALRPRRCFHRNAHTHWHVSLSVRARAVIIIITETMRARVFDVRARARLIERVTGRVRAASRAGLSERRKQNKHAGDRVACWRG